MGNSHSDSQSIKGKTSIPNPVEKEIIIKCSLEEMMRAFFKDYVIVWHDPNVKNQENQQYITRLKKFCEVFRFTEWEKVKDYIQSAQAVCHIITSGTNGELLTKEISTSQSVANIYVFCGNKAYHSTWAQNYHKVSCVETEIEAILSKIQQNLLEWYKEASSLKLNLPAFAPIFNDSDKSEMNHLHRYLRIIPKFKNREQAKDDFVRLSRKIYSDPINEKLLKEFETDYNRYNKGKTLRWYTRESFLYKVTNNCLRIATSDSIQYCRLLLKDIEQAIKDQYRTKSKSFNGLLYRGAYLSEKEWSSLKENLDKEIEIHGFLSVSKKKSVALNFMQTDPSKKVLITILVPKGPNEEEQGFAEIEEFSNYPDEKEILFNVRSRFTVLETEDNYIYSEASKCRHLVLLYGAQGFRKFIAEKNPIQEVSIPSMESISCVHCNAKNERLFFVSIADPQKQTYCCQKCIDSKVGPFLLIPTMDKMGESYSTKIKGCPLIMDSSQEQTPFYGYKCCNCQAKNQKSYFICTDCGAKESKWCENCFEKVSKCREIGHHNIVFETGPFSFWCEKMSANELTHLEFQKNLVQKDDDVFQQAQMYFESHKYEKAIEYYSLYIHENEAKGKNANLATSYNNIGSVYDGQGEYKKALEYYLKSLDIYKSVYGEDNHPSVATSYNNIGLVYKNQGEYKNALEYYLKSLDIHKSVYGEDNHPSVATSYHNIGVVYKNQGEYKKALEYYLKSLDIYKSVYGGDNHPSVATSYHNLGNVYQDQGEYKKALEYYLKCLDIRTSVYGDNHPEVATSYHNIGMVYDTQGEYNKALEYYLKSLDIKKSVYRGDNHPSVAASYHNIGSAYDSQGEYKKALEYYLKSLDIYKSVYGGDNHPSIATSYHNIGSVYKNQGEYNKALEFYLKSLDIRKSVYGDNHPSVTTSYNNIGSVYYNQGEYKKALEYFLKSLDVKKSFYGGDNHPSVATSYNNIGMVYDTQGEYKNALEYYFKSLDIYKSIYGGDNHPSVATSYNNIGSVYDSQGEYKKALEYYLKSLDIRKSVYGEDNHPEIATSYNNIGMVYSNQGEYKKALEYYLKSLDIKKIVYGGDNHPSVAISYNNIGNVYYNQGEYKKALEYYMKSLDIKKIVYGDYHPSAIETQNLILKIQSLH